MRSGITYLVLTALSLCLCRTVSGQRVEFSHEGGFYADTFSLSMQMVGVADSGYTLHYTLNGNEPTECDAQYVAPLPLTAECYSPSAIYRVQNVPEDRWFAPESVEHIIVVRAAVFDTAGDRCSPVATQSYLIDSLMGRRIELPVVSLCVDSLSLFDHDTGLFVPGVCFESAYRYNTGNYFQKGRNWERRAAFAYYDRDGGALAQDCGLRTHGNSQRVLVQKGMSLYARTEYGSKQFVYPFFGDGGHYRRLVLRPWQTSWSSAGVEDWICQRIADSLRCDNLASRPVVLFLNGEYWGVYFLGEKADERYVREHYGVEADEVDFLAYWGNEVEYGSARRWNSLYDWLQQADLTRQKDMDYLASQVDTAELLDYMLLQVLVQNDDWPLNNVRFWSTREIPWRWVFFDGDGSLATFPDNAPILDYMTSASPWPTTHTSPQATLLFRRLLANREFLERSLARMRQLVATSFAYSNTEPLLRQIVGEVSGEVQYQMRRFDTPSSLWRWNAMIASINDYLRSEPEAMLNEYTVFFGLNRQEFQHDRVTVYDRYGRVVYSGKAPGNGKLPLELMQGHYYIHLDSSDEVQRYIVK